jgi:DNA polymerase III subunit beta
MRCSVEKLKAAWKQVAGICPAKTPKEIYQYVRLDIAGTAFSLAATDGEVFVTIGDCATPEFSRLLPAKAFTRLLDVATGDEIEFSEQSITCGADTWELQSPDVDDWQFSGVPDTGRNYNVDCDAITNGLAISILSVDAESTRYALGGVLFDFINADTLGLVATDGRRLSICEIDCECEGNADSDTDAVVPLKTLKTLMAICGNAGEMSFAYGLTGGIVFRCGDAVIHSPLVAGRFPDWRKVMPDTKQSQFEFPAGELSASLKSAAITTSEESRGLNVTFNDAGITITSHAADVGRSRITRQLEFGDMARMTINSDYLLPLLNKVGGDCELTLDYIDSESPLLFSHDGGLRYLLMPLSA